jgi:predicted HicB family RNase H-like nuclease
MSENIMRYKNYAARVEYSPEDKCFVGRVLGIRDVVGFHGESVAELERDFRETMEFYFDTCRKEGKEPDRPYSGKLVLRLSPELHRQIALASEAHGKSINDTILDALQESEAVQTATKPVKKPAARGRKMKALAGK